ncbi:MAG TPA: hypothetical protein VIA18_27775, partial [Polyangia bacterium]|nr:hypothetical protein [Polyangia bacterium]
TLAGFATVAAANETSSATDYGNGTLEYAIVLPSGQAFVQLFVRQNGIQNIALDIAHLGTDLGDGTTRYAITISNYYKPGTIIEYRFYHYLPNSPGLFTPGPIENEWRWFTYGQPRVSFGGDDYFVGPYTMGSGGSIDTEIYTTYAASNIEPVATGWQLDRASATPFAAPLLGPSATMLAVYVAACDGSGWVRIDTTPFAVAAPAETSNAGEYDWSGTFDAQLPGQTVDGRYECGGYDTIVDTLIGPQTLRTAAGVTFAYVVAHRSS